MVSGPIAIIPVPTRYLMKPKDAALFLGCDTGTLKELPIRCKDRGGRRVYLVEDLKAYADALPEWKNGVRESPSSLSQRNERTED